MCPALGWIEVPSPRGSAATIRECAAGYPTARHFSEPILHWFIDIDKRVLANRFLVGCMWCNETRGSVRSALTRWLGAAHMLIYHYE